MKQKWRSIVVNHQPFRYIIHTRYNIPTSRAITKLNIFEPNSKIACITIAFETWEDPITGNPLYTGTTLFNKNTQTIETYNLNHPAQIRWWIQYAIQSGWSPIDTLDIPDGLSVLKEHGYVIDPILPTTST